MTSFTTLPSSTGCVTVRRPTGCHSNRIYITYFTVETVAQQKLNRRQINEVLVAGRLKISLFVASLVFSLFLSLSLSVHTLLATCMLLDSIHGRTAVCQSVVSSRPMRPTNQPTTGLHPLLGSVCVQQLSVAQHQYQPQFQLLQSSIASTDRNRRPQLLWYWRQSAAAVFGVDIVSWDGAVCSLSAVATRWVSRIYTLGR